MPRGGARPGSGRKKSETTILKKLAIAAANGEAEKSLQFCVQMRDDPTVPKGIQLAAASEVMDRVWGKAPQAIKHTAPEGRMVLVFNAPAAAPVALALTFGGNGNGNGHTNGNGDGAHANGNGNQT